MSSAKNIRNIAIIAHVDHGKTTLVDELLKQGGAFRENQQTTERMMDSMDLEREKGITIRSKSTSVHWREHTINIVDTPGHADFGAEVERVMRMVDGVLLLCDAYEGPQAQTRFVLKKALAEGLRPVVFVNKIDRPNSEPEAVHDKILELFLELDASEEQFNAPFLYGSAKNGFAVRELGDEPANMDPLFETVLEYVPAPVIEEGQPLRMLVSNIDWDNYVGRVAVGKILSGSVKPGDTVYVARRDGSRVRAKLTRLFTYSGLASADSQAVYAGDIVGLAGFVDVDIGETLLGNPEGEALPFVAIDPPTISMELAVNDGPLAGQEGKLVTSRQIGDRLDREAKSNISIIVEPGSAGGVFSIKARGAMQIAVLVETMRREGYEVLVSRPTVIYKRDESGRRLEPFETLWVETPDECVGGVMKAVAERKGKVENMVQHASSTTIEAYIPTRGIIGLEFELTNLSSGRAVFSHLFKEYAPFAGPIATRSTGTLVSTSQGVTTTYTLNLLEDRGKLFVGPGETVYTGMIVGENPRKEDLPVNPTKEKQLSNVRSSGEGKGPQLSPPLRLSLERSIEYIAEDEFVEATPKSLRLRKRILDFEARKRAAKQAAAVEG